MQTTQMWCELCKFKACKLCKNSCDAQTMPFLQGCTMGFPDSGRHKKRGGEETTCRTHEQFSEHAFTNSQHRRNVLQKECNYGSKRSALYQLFVGSQALFWLMNQPVAQDFGKLILVAWKIHHREIAGLPINNAIFDATRLVVFFTYTTFKECLV